MKSLCTGTHTLSEMTGYTVVSLDLRNVIAVILQGRGVNRTQPDDIYSQGLDVVQLIRAYRSISQSFASLADPSLPQPTLLVMPAKSPMPSALLSQLCRKISYRFIRMEQGIWKRLRTNCEARSDRLQPVGIDRSDIVSLDMVGAPETCLFPPFRVRLIGNHY